MIDFSDCEVNVFRSFNGANGSKLSIVYKGHDYVLKFPSLAKNRTDRSYANNCFSEHVCCGVLDTIGMDVQNTILGTYHEKIVVACRDFTEGGYKFADFGTLKNTCYSSSENGYGTELTEIELAIKEQKWVDTETLSSFFWDMFICDSLIGNFDRHNGNWGFLIDENKNSARIAPIFDCASSLFPQLRIDDYRKVLDDPSEIRARVYNWPNSSIKVNNKKVNYFEFISSLSNQDCNEALRRIYPRIDQDRIWSVINDDEDLLDIQKEFYTTMLIERKERILDYSFEKLESLD
ncbi:MAG: hypothetical protein A3205_08800 [Methanomassiliicoccales archaeon Mx-03]|nr:MAG: hypothetical protein A3205_08800 [Methanomassiliicoccales archaeon Mx-03]